MKRKLFLTTTAAVALLLGACGGQGNDSEENDTEAATGGESGGSVCEEVFETGNPIADRAEQAREDLDAGEITDEVSFDEVNLLEQRITALSDEADEDVAGLLEEVNAPFTEAVEQVNDAQYSADEAGEEMEFPDLDVDTDGSEQAQDELAETCEVDEAS